MTKKTVFLDTTLGLFEQRWQMFCDANNIAKDHLPYERYKTLFYFGAREFLQLQHEFYEEFLENGDHGRSIAQLESIKHEIAAWAAAQIPIEH